MATPVKFELSLSIELSENNVLTTKMQVLVDSKPIGYVSRLRVDKDSDETLPMIEIDMLRGLSPFLDDSAKKLFEKAEKDFELLKRVPGVKCVMPAPRKTPL